jgi:hypothetical protein
MNELKIFLLYFLFCCLLAGGIIAYVEYLDTVELEDKLIGSERPENFILADKLCKFYGFDKAAKLIDDGRKIKMLCEE